MRAWLNQEALLRKKVFLESFPRSREENKKYIVSEAQ